MASTIDSSLSPLRPVYPPLDQAAQRNEPAKLKALISTLKLIPHIEGGYFVETDRDPYRVSNPFAQHATTPGRKKSAQETTSFSTSTGTVSANLDDKLTASDKAAAEQSSKTDNSDTTRHASTSIHYLLTPTTPLGAFHRNRGRTIHTLHRGRGRYVLIHADEVMPHYGSHDGVRRKARVETFVVGLDTDKGERLQWVVEGGKYKASYLLEDDDGSGESVGGLLISETVVPGFEYCDHDFLREERFEALVSEEQVCFFEPCWSCGAFMGKGGRADVLVYRPMR